MKRLLFIALLCSWAGSARAQAVAVAPLAIPRAQFLSATGIPLAGGCLNFFQAGTSTPQAIYADSGGVNQLANPLTLDAAGEASVWMSNVSYRIVANAGVVGQPCSSALGAQLWVEDFKNVFSIINSGANYIVASATSDPSGSVGELGYRSDFGCFRGFTSLWDCFTQNTATQTLTNKTLTSPIINTPAVNSPTITTPIINGASTGTGLQGTDTKLLSSGTISGVLSAPLCLDALGGATTTACIPVVGSAIGCTAIGPATIGNNNAQQNLLSCTVPANALAAGSLLNVDVVGLEGTASAQTITITASIGGGTACGSTFSAAIAANQPFNFSGKFAVLTAGAGGTANWSCEIWGPGNGIAGNNGVVGAPTISVNTTIPNTLLITVQMSVANAGNAVSGQLLKAVIF